MRSALADLEKKAKSNAAKIVSDIFSKPEQLDKIDIIRSRFVSQKTATEAQLKMAIHSQLDGVKLGLAKLDDGLEESKKCTIRFSDLEHSLSQLGGLSSSLLELKNLSKKYKQLAAAMENMSYLVKVPEAMEQAKSLIESKQLLEAHKIIQEVEGVRDELMSEVHKQQAISDLETLRTFFIGIEELNKSMASEMMIFGSRLSSAVVTQGVLTANCVRIIDREERILASSMDKEDDKNRLVRHNEMIRQCALEDLKIAKKAIAGG
ncbi:unnamed protein product [Protopolystoma xenopodis]|uniref:Uncharacterized protein n=1 Tax=Protopolystoma xenopodis TaxID=117903 RepID=A0A3S5B6A2_9PLAT|nr:unnamed protein product [Protopolystoma xenopodis]